MVPSDYWKTLKSFMKTTTNFSIPPIFHNGSNVFDNNLKAKLFHDFFVNQTKLDETGATLPNLTLLNRETHNNINIAAD